MQEQLHSRHDLRRLLLLRKNHETEKSAPFNLIFLQKRIAQEIYQEL
ncbi:MAG: hypothetical protein IJR94_03265 [Synergistaceae bacterium]|nr:hypothetical protein [Synergistaceae bacterium]